MLRAEAARRQDARHAEARRTSVAEAARRYGPLLLGGALVLPLVAYAWVGSFSRYTADDYCWAAILGAQGFWQAQVHWYTVYSPRYAFTFLVNLTELVGPPIVPFLPPLALAGWLAALTWSLSAVFRLRTAFVLGALVAFATLQTTPDRAQSLYWQTGLLTYLLPLILASVFLGLAARSGGGAWRLGLSFLLTFVAGGLSETYLIPQNVGLTLACLVVRNRKHFVAGLAGGVAALATIVVAPSTAARVGGSPADLWLASAAAVATAVVQAGQLVVHFPLSVALCLCVPAALGAAGWLEWDARGHRQQLAVVTAVIGLTLPFCFFPSFYAQNGNPPARSLIVPQVLLIGYLVYAGLFLSPLAHRAPTHALGLVMALLALVPLGAAAATLPERATAARYAVLWDQEDATIRDLRDAGATRLLVPPLPPNLGEQFVTANPTYWFNSCVARYYRVDSIVAVGPS
jgi:Family of unknown function (DUF6056)